jgi:hypothetical protein
MKPSFNTLYVNYLYPYPRPCDVSILTSVPFG